MSADVGIIYKRKLLSFLASVLKVGHDVGNLAAVNQRVILCKIVNAFVYRAGINIYRLYNQILSKPKVLIPF